MNYFATSMLAFGIMLAALPAARADMTCSQTSLIPPNSTVNGNLIVPPSAECVLNGVTVTGNVQVQTNAVLFLTNAVQGTTIDGNVQVGAGAGLAALESVLPFTIGGNLTADQCNLVTLAQGNSIVIGGNVLLQYCTLGVNISAGEIAGNFACNNNPLCNLGASNIKGNAQIDDNASADVEGNTIGGNLQCQGNEAINGGSNTVGGNETGQCAHF